MNTVDKVRYGGRSLGEERKSITDRKWYPWFISAMSFMVQFVGISFHGSFGPLYVKMLRHFQERDTKTGNTFLFLIHSC